MKILFLNHNVAWSGTFFRAYHLGRELVQRGHDVTLVTTHRSRRFGAERVEKGGVTIIYSPDLAWGPARNGWDPSNALRRAWSLRSFDCEVVHAFDSRPAVIIPALTVRRRSGATLVMDWADWWGRGGTTEERSGWLVRTLFGPVETWFEEAFRNDADGTTVISRALGERAAWLGVRPERILRLPNGCDPTGIQPGSRERHRLRLGLDPASRILLHVGVLFRGDADLLFDMFRVAHSREPHLRLVMVGKPRVRVPADLRGSGAVRLTGFVELEGLQAWLAAADLCVIPLRDTLANRGRWPSKINDYFAAGRPTLMPSVGDAAAVVEEYAAGWTAAPDARSLADRCLEVIGNRDLLAEAGRRARSVAEGVLSWPRLADQVLTFYSSLL